MTKKYKIMLGCKLWNIHVLDSPRSGWPDYANGEADLKRKTIYILDGPPNVLDWTLGHEVLHISLKKRRRMTLLPYLEEEIVTEQSNYVKDLHKFFENKDRWKSYEEVGG